MKKITTDGFTALWTPDRFAQIDPILAPRAFKNSILDVISRTDIAINSNHCVVIADLCLELKARVTKSFHVVRSYHPPSDQQKQTFNSWIASHLPDSIDISDFVSFLQRAAGATL